MPAASPAQTNRPAAQIRVVELQGTVEILPEGREPWRAALTNQLLKPLDHKDGTDANDVITLNFGVNASDTDGDTTSGTFHIVVD